MQGNEIFGPMFGVMLLTTVVWVYMYAKRIPFLQSIDLEPNDITPAELMQRSPPSVANPSDNLKNLFEMPILFYALSIYLYVTQQVDQIYVVAAWLFFVFRLAHSVVHCTVNIVLLRFGLYAVSSLALFFMLLRAAFAHF